jgi:uncharacterized OB-fold protein
LSAWPTGSRCEDCGAVAYPRQRYCRGCGAWDRMVDAPLSARGTLVTWSTIHVAPPRAGFEPPYAVGYADLPEGVRLFAPIAVDGEALAIDQQMELTVDAGFPLALRPAR